MSKKSMSSSEPQVSLSRPQRNTKAKIVFDPSDNNIPKKRIKQHTKSGKPIEKFSTNNEKLYEETASILKKPIETNNVKKSIENKTAKKLVKNNSISSVKSHSDPVNGFNDPLSDELAASSSNKNKDDYSNDNPVSKDNSDLKEICYYCEKYIKSHKNVVDCRICLRGFHKDCLLSEEPTWKFKLDHSIFLCSTCREKRCSKCCIDEYNLKTFIRCLSCKVGYHRKCYEGYDIKPMHAIKSCTSEFSYLCIPCMTIATERIPEIEDIEFLSQSSTNSKSDDDNNEDNEDDLRSNISYGSSQSANHDENLSRPKIDEINIPDIKNWNKTQVFNYFLDRLPGKVAQQIIEEDLDGNGILLFQRRDLTRLRLSTGMALKFYKLVRILQTRCKLYTVYWE